MGIQTSILNLSVEVVRDAEVEDTAEFSSSSDKSQSGIVNY